jgi:hypothetical protein
MIYEIARRVFHLYYQNEIADGSNKDFKQMLEAIERKDKYAADLLRDVKLKFDSYQFVKQDIELRSKVKEIWIMHVERTYNELNISMENFNLWSAKHQLAPFTHDNIIE